MFNNSDRKKARLTVDITSNKELSVGTYNLYMGGSVFYGFLINFLSVMFLEDFFLSINPIAFLVAYFVLCIAGSIVSATSNNPIVSFVGYNMIVLPIGGLLTIALQGYSGADIMAAIMVTGIVVLAMTALAIIKPDLFNGIGKALLIALILALVGEIVAMCFGYGGNAFNWIFVILFSTYIGYDYAKAQKYPKCLDNAIDSAVDIYLDIINLFLRILEIISKSDD